MHLVLRLQPVKVAKILQEDVRIPNIPHIIVRASMNVRSLFLWFCGNFLFKGYSQINLHVCVQTELRSTCIILLKHNSCFFLLLLLFCCKNCLSVVQFKQNCILYHHLQNRLCFNMLEILIKSIAIIKGVQLSTPKLKEKN